jgi:hypothetical protein
MGGEVQPESGERGLTRPFSHNMYGAWIWLVLPDRIKGISGIWDGQNFQTCMKSYNITRFFQVDGGGWSVENA